LMSNRERVGVAQIVDILALTTKVAAIEAHTLAVCRKLFRSCLRVKGSKRSE
jgi:hypothetical protein